MPHRWPTHREYLDTVQPVLIDKPGWFSSLRAESVAQLQRHLAVAHEELVDAVERLQRLGLVPKPAGNHRASKVFYRDGHQAVLEAVHSGELMLLYDMRLACSEFAYNFIEEHTLASEWDSLAADRRIVDSCRLLKGAEDLLRGHHELETDHQHFLLEHLDLPDDLVPDFREARDLFSVGLESAGLFAAGRGVERVLRRIAQRRKLRVLVRKKEKPVDALPFAQVIEALGRFTWHSDGRQLLARDIKALLDLVRESRNRAAHPDDSGDAVDPREMAVVMAKRSTELWQGTCGRRRLTSPVVELGDPK